MSDLMKFAEVSQAEINRLPGTKNIYFFFDKFIDFFYLF